MKKLQVYLALQIKRVSRAFPAIIIMTFLLAGAMGLLVWMKLQSTQDGSGQSKVKLGIVGNDEESYLGVGIYALEHLDSSRFTCEFRHLSEADAKQQLEKGEISGYFIIPDGFVRSIIDGENKQVTFISGSSQAGIGTILIEQLAASISRIITDTQAGIYSMHEFYLEYDELESLYSDETDLNMLYLQLIMNRNGMYQIDQISITNQLSAMGYYTCAMILLFLLLWGINCCRLFVREDMALPRLLAAQGMHATAQMFAEFAAYLFLMFLNYVCIAAALSGIMQITGISLTELEGGGLAGHFVFFLRLLPVLPVIASMQLLLYEIVSGIISGILLNFGFAICLGYLSGCFYPLAYFPEIIQKAAEIFPTGIALSYMTDCLKEKFPASFAGLFCWTVLFFVTAVLVRKRKLVK